MWETLFPAGKERIPSIGLVFCGFALGFCGILACLSLKLGGYGTKAVVAALFLLWGALGAFFLTRQKLTPKYFCLCLFFLGLGLLLRVVCMEHVTLDYQDFLAKWAAFFRENGGVSALSQPVGNYNVPYLYFLAVISYLPVPDLYLIKLFSIFFDLLLAFSALRLSKKLFHSDLSAALSFGLALILPTVVLNGAYWGQCDTIYGALVLLALADALDEHPARSVAALGLAFAFKLQTVFIMPLWCVFWYAGRVKFRHLLLFPACNLVVALPALLLGKPFGDILSIYVGQTVEYNHHLTLNAPSIYALIPYGVDVDVAFWAKVGICVAFAFVLAVLIWLFFYRKRLTDDHLLTAAVIFAIGIPLLLPHMHERYFFLADVLSIVWATKNWKRASIPVAVQIASLGGYHAYLVLRYAFPMAWGAWLLLAALVGSMVYLAYSLKTEKHA